MTTKRELEKLAREAFGRGAKAEEHRSDWSGLWFVVVSQRDEEGRTSREFFYSHKERIDARDVVAAALRGIIAEAGR